MVGPETFWDWFRECESRSEVVALGVKSNTSAVFHERELRSRGMLRSVSGMPSPTSPRVTAATVSITIPCCESSEGRGASSEYQSLTRSLTFQDTLKRAFPRLIGPLAVPL